MVVTTCLVAFQGWAQPAKVARGKYLVEEVGRCQECHTPRSPDGVFDKEKWMKGSVLLFQPIEPIKGWHKTAPDITRAGRLWQKWGEPALIRFLVTGLSPGGKPPGAPMPVYKVSQDDAEAIVEYLKTLQ
ncbi:MAG TPA: cytochrome c [Bryobacteraceae bacterium]|jgi:mono/diheme cytochrome c family protein|nr:cytochrome c [Bryobacteraceae bacterium]